MATIAKFDAQGNVSTQGIVSKEMFPLVAKAKEMKSQGKTLVDFTKLLLTQKLKDEWKSLCDQKANEDNVVIDDSNYDQALEDCVEEKAAITQEAAPETKNAIMAEKRSNPIQLVKAGTKLNLSTPKSMYKRGKNEFIFAGVLKSVNIHTINGRGGKLEFVNTGRAFKKGQYESLGKRNFTLAFEIEAPFGQNYNAFDTKGKENRNKTVEFRVDQLLGSNNKRNRDLIEVIYRNVIAGGANADLKQETTLDLYKAVIDELEEGGVESTAVKITTEKVYVQMQCEERIAGVTMYPESLSNVEKLNNPLTDLIVETRPNLITGDSEEVVLAYHNVDAFAGVTINKIDVSQWDTEVAKQKQTTGAKNLISTLSEGKESGLLTDKMIVEIFTAKM